MKTTKEGSGFGPQVEQRLAVMLVGEKALVGRSAEPNSKTSLVHHLPTAIVFVAVVALVLHGPIAQYADYHNFADHRAWLGIPNAFDVLSNLGFAATGFWGLYRVWPRRNDPAMVAGWPGFALFMGSLIFTALGSSFYHLAPDNVRLIWDRVPIALACGGLLAGVCAQLKPDVNGVRITGLLATTAIASVTWWYVTGVDGSGDLRPYLLLQALPLVLIPLWQWIYEAPRADKTAFAIAIGLYVVAKAAELLDHQLFSLFDSISGHTLKHLLAAAAAAVIVARLIHRVDARESAQDCSVAIREN